MSPQLDAILPRAGRVSVSGGFFFSLLTVDSLDAHVTKRVKYATIAVSGCLVVVVGCCRGVPRRSITHMTNCVFLVRDRGRCVYSIAVP